ncbi:hypothetical protein KGM_212865 [Danaus plexippus plexippus]|uniref:Uncharacterized protein n=1 Tax=Danaus plexippus plexippus TaxID=278856 RepID=A0A212EYH7_DANPL|nr:hypothetical protein KGM_212865 [Danaus plexippus plexippus]
MYHLFVPDRSQSFGPYRGGYVPSQGYNQGYNRSYNTQGQDRGYNQDRGNHNQDRGNHNQGYRQNYNSNQNYRQNQGYSQNKYQGGYQRQGNDRQGYGQGNNQNQRPSGSIAMLYILYQTQLDELQSTGSVSRPPHISVYAAEVIHRPVRRPVGRLAYDDVD